MIASTEIQDHLQIHANGTCRTPGLDCINVRISLLHSCVHSVYLLYAW